MTVASALFSSRALGSVTGIVEEARVDEPKNDMKRLCAARVQPPCHSTHSVALQALNCQDIRPSGSVLSSLSPRASQKACSRRSCQSSPDIQRAPQCKVQHRRLREWRRSRIPPRLVLLSFCFTSCSSAVREKSHCFTIQQGTFALALLSQSKDIKSQDRHA